MKTIPVFTVVLACSGCVPLAVAGIEHHRAAKMENQERETWAPRVGSYTYDQAISDYGPPAQRADLSTGGFVVQWLWDHGATATTVRMTGDVSRTRARANLETLQLTFTSGGVLADWRWNYQ